MPNDAQTPGITDHRLSSPDYADNFRDLHTPLSDHEALVAARLQDLGPAQVLGALVGQRAEHRRIRHDRASHADGLLRPDWYRQEPDHQYCGEHTRPSENPGSPSKPTRVEEAFHTISG